MITKKYLRPSACAWLASLIFAGSALPALAAKAAKTAPPSAATPYPSRLVLPLPEPNPPASGHRFNGSIRKIVVEVQSVGIGEKQAAEHAKAAGLKRKAEAD